MKLLFTISFCFVLIISYCQAPSIKWVESLGGSAFDGDESQQGYLKVRQTSDNGSIVVGTTSSTDEYAQGNHGGEDILVLKLNSQGSVEWYKCLGGSSNDYPTGVQQTFDGGYIISGAAYSNDGDVSGNHGGYDVWVIKLDSSGSIIWQKTYGGTKVDVPTGGIALTKDSGYIVACQSNSFDGDVTEKGNGFDDYWIIKLDQAGSIIWQKKFGGSYEEFPTKIDQTFDGGYIIGGYTNSTDGDISGNHGGVDDAWIIKIDSIGNLTWQKCIGGSLRDENRGIKQTKDSGFIASITVKSNDGDITGNHGNQDYMLAKLDKNGGLTWTKCYGGSGDDICEDIQLVNGYYLITGSSNSIDGDVSGNHGDYDYWTVKTDTLGNIIWQTSLGGSGVDEASSISYKQGIGYLIAGQSNSVDGDIIGHYSDYDFWIAELNDDAILPVKLLSFIAQKQNTTALLQWQTANEISNNYFSIERSPDSKLFYSIGTKPALNNSNNANYSFTDNAPLKVTNYYRLKQVDKDGKYTYSKIVSVDFSSNATTFAVYPNPANSNLNITLPNSNSVSNIILYDVNGKKVLHEQINSNTTSKQLDISKLAPGVYNVILMQDGKQQTINVIKK